MITLQARNSSITSNIEDAADAHMVTTTPNEEILLMVLSMFSFSTVQVNHPKFGTFKVLILKEVHEPFSSNNKGPIHEERRLQIKELDEWWTHKPRTHDKPKLRQDELNTFPNQLKVGDKVLLDPADPHIVTTKLNEEIPLTVLSIFPFDIVEVNHPKFGTFKDLWTNEPLPPPEYPPPPSCRLSPKLQK
ncbi:hypothetical protein GOBAR_AA21820 [Gossypium barbadense]|uniref:Uncharacterized protein n=1 Tax=Gossypium barbadense TaxID=3634 RepID=A0A2P5X691_GOSBA|nr:hypothetical protein GOBAR_AA21820 [Gossypium barbadense]